MESWNVGIVVKSPLHISLRGVVYREDRWWLAHCLELDIVGQGDTIQEASESMIELCVAQIQEAIKDANVGSIFHPAPARYFEMWSRAKAREAKADVHDPVQEFDIRELAFA